MAKGMEMKANKLSKWALVDSLIPLQAKSGTRWVLRATVSITCREMQVISSRKCKALMASPKKRDGRSSDSKIAFQRKEKHRNAMIYDPGADTKVR